MTDNVIPSPTAAQVTYTGHPLTSPLVLGAVATAIVTAITGYASSKGFHLLDDPALQAQLVTYLGLALTGLAHWIWPHKDGRLSFYAPGSTPAPQDLPAGKTSMVKIPTPTAAVQEVDVRSGDSVAAIIRTAEVAAAIASAKMSADKGRPVPVTVTETPGNKPNEAVKISAAEIAKAPSVPLNVVPSPAPRAA